MTDARTALKSLLIYTVCIPLALVLGYLLANPMDIQGLTLIGAVFLVLAAPLAIHFHYPFMLLAWNLGATVFFLPGRMSLWMVSILLSFGVAFTHRILDKRVQFLWIPEITRPLVVLALVTIATAELRGGFGFRSMGGDAVGARRYIELLVGILGFFALTTRHIAVGQVRRYLTLFYLGATAGALALLYGHLPAFMNFIFLFIPPPTVDPEGAGVFSAFRSLTWPSIAVISYMTARHGLRGILSLRHFWRLLIFLAALQLVLFSASRLGVVVVMIIVALQFWLEGLIRTRMTIFILAFLLLSASVAVPFATRLPLSMQRALAVLPIEVDPIARATAEGSSEWRRQIWAVTIPQIPQYLLLGKGYAISREDFGFMTDRSFGEASVENRAATIAGDYHNGPLSVIMPFGIWGVLAFVWFLIAAIRVLRANYRYGAAELKNINTFLLTSFLMSVITFIFVFGSLQTGMIGFTGIIGLSVALNGGVARPPGRPAPVRNFKLIPAILERTAQSGSTTAPVARP